jgi:hypothetical protein
MSTTRFGWLAVLLLASCQPLPHPFAEDVPPPGSLNPRDSRAVTVMPIDGEPRATADKLAAALASALQEREIAASNKAVGRTSYELNGDIQAGNPKGGRTQLIFSWKLSDPADRVVGSRSERIDAPAGAWEAGEESAVGRLAAESAQRIAGLLIEEAPVEAAAGGRIRVRVDPAEGAPGDGGRALREAMANLLKRQEPLSVDDPKAAADLVVAAEIAVAKPRQGKQNVRIVWHLRRGDGSEIGTVAQENDVPAGMLDGAWGDVAYSIAMSAQDGILALIDRAAGTAGPS